LLYRTSNGSSALTLLRFIDLLPEPLERVLSPFAIKDRDLDIENAQKRVCLVFFTGSLTFFCKSRSVTLKLDRASLKSSDRNFCYLVDKRDATVGVLVAVQAEPCVKPNRAISRTTSSLATRLSHKAVHASA